MDVQPPKPTPEVARRAEELLREQLAEIGVAVSVLTPDEIARDMQCRVAPDSSMTYLWRGEPILRIEPEIRPDSVLWRMFTKDDSTFN